LGKPWKYLWVMISPLSIQKHFLLYNSTHWGHKPMKSPLISYSTVFSLGEFSLLGRIVFFKCQKMSVFWVFCLSNLKIFGKLHRILHQVPVGHQRYRRMLQILYFHIFIAKIGQTI
jgi:hypothetical protein